MKKPSSAEKNLTIIGIGSSAGGLEAIRELVSTLPASAPVSYVVVQHMSPHHKSLMTELVARQTELSVRDVSDGVVPEENVIYITPPNHDVVYRDGKLNLIDPSPEIAAPKPSVDRFLLSLADAYGEKTMGIILSGTGSDGAYGVQAIREAGGITIAQDVDSAKYDGMPRAAVQTGCVDLILRPQEIGTHLQKILSSPRNFDAIRQEELQISPNADLLQILLARTRMDFREYKQTTIGRRIERRMMALGIETKEEYTQFLRNTPRAVDALFKDLLISVTRFFRDRTEFDSLQALLPGLLSDRDGGPLRVWIAGCATGEEAYSIAMLIAEALGGPTTVLKSHVQIFATDIDSAALKVARKGIYNAAALDDISPEYAEKYLIKQNDGVRVIENLRSAILFSEHNVAQDPPFQKIDLLCCRNLLIYFGGNLQNKVMSRFHYAMKQNALLFLGTAESVAGAENLFAADKTSSHIFRKRSLRAGASLPYNAQRSSIAVPARRHAPPEAVSTDRQFFESLAQSLGANSVLVTEDYTIARVFGDVSPYVQMTERSSLKMHLDLLRSPLREEARSLVTIALKNGEKRSGVRHLLAEDNTDEVRLDVYPIVARDINERAALIVFNPSKVARPAVDSPRATSTDAETAQRIMLLENEVDTTREALQQTIEELETSNEELQSLNEELQSTNEELQATNEELETSNEELQSTNEELITVNEELQVTAAELTGRTSELTSVLENAPMSILVMDNALQITQATNRALDHFGLRRPLSSPHVSQCILPEAYPTLAPFCSEALRVGHPVQKEFTSRETRIVLTCSPYFDIHGHIMGVTLLSTEFPGLAREMEALLETSQLLLMHRTAEGEILRASAQAAALLKCNREKLVGRNINELVPPETARILNEDADRVIAGVNQGPTKLFQLVMSEGEAPVALSMDRFRFQRNDGEAPSVLLVATDVTEQQNARTQSEARLRQLQLLQDFAHIGYWSVDVASQTPYWSQEVYRIHGVEYDDRHISMEHALSYYHPDDIEDVSKLVEAAIENKEEFSFTKRIIRKGGDVVHVETYGLPVLDTDGKVDQIVGVIREVPAPEGT